MHTLSARLCVSWARAEEDPADLYEAVRRGQKNDYNDAPGYLTTCTPRMYNIRRTAGVVFNAPL